MQATPAEIGTLAAVGSLPFLPFSLPTGVPPLTPATLFGIRLYRIRQ